MQPSNPYDQIIKELELKVSILKYQLEQASKQLDKSHGAEYQNLKIRYGILLVHVKMGEIALLELKTVPIVPIKERLL